MSVAFGHRISYQKLRFHFVFVPLQAMDMGGSEQFMKLVQKGNKNLTDTIIYKFKNDQQKHGDREL